MKRIRLLLLYVLLFIGSNAVCAQSSSSMTMDELRQMVIATNARLPLSLGQMMELESMNLSSSEMAIVINVNDMYGTFGKFSQQSVELQKKNAIVALGSIKSEDMTAMFQSLSAHRLNLRMTYAIAGTGKKVEVLLTPADLQVAIKMDKDPLTYLKLTAEVNRQSLPMDMGSGMTMTDIRLSDKQLEYVFEIDESMMSIDILKQQEQNIRPAMERMLSSKGDMTIVLQLSAMVECNMDLAYRYVGNVTKKEFVLTIGSKRLKELLDSTDME